MSRAELHQPLCLNIPTSVWPVRGLYSGQRLTVSALSPIATSIEAKGTIERCSRNMVITTGTGDPKPEFSPAGLAANQY